jgi:phosphopantothenoylcysteine decarboxylase/phosphopantothenate--cysteine ligase
MNVHYVGETGRPGERRSSEARGARIVGPASGSLACGYEGTGRLADAEDIVGEVLCILAPQDLAGEHVLLSAGPTQEAVGSRPLPVESLERKDGYAIAEVARRRGAEVTLVSGPTALAPARRRGRAGATAREMARAVDEAFARRRPWCMTAAVADYRPREPARGSSRRERHADARARAEPRHPGGLGARKGGGSWSGSPPRRTTSAARRAGSSPRSAST